MDVELRAAERAFAEEPSTDRLRAVLAALVRGGRSVDVPARVIAHVRDAWRALDAEQVGALRGLEGRAGPVDGLTAADFVVDLVGWRLPADLGAHVFVEARRARTRRLHHLSSDDVVELERTCWGGAWTGTDVHVRLRRREGALTSVAHLLLPAAAHDDEAEAARRAIEDLRRVAAAAGSTIDERDGGLAFGD